MEGKQIDQVLTQDPITASYFRGVFASDIIPDLRENEGIIVNLDSSTEPGSHWIAFFVMDSQTLEMFDSYGNSPQFYGNRFENFISKYSTIHWNSTMFQSPTSNVCGAYCIYFIYKKCQGQSLCTIVNKLSLCKNNDFRMYQFVKKKYGVRMIFRK